MVGNEHDGLTPEAIAAADVRFGIPMHGLTQSLNLSVATALIVERASTLRRAALGPPTDLTEEAILELRARFYAASVRGAEAHLGTRGFLNRRGPGDRLSGMAAGPLARRSRPRRPGGKRGTTKSKVRARAPSRGGGGDAGAALEARAAHRRHHRDAGSVRRDCGGGGSLQLLRQRSQAPRPRAPRRLSPQAGDPHPRPRRRADRRARQREAHRHPLRGDPQAAGQRRRLGRGRRLLPARWAQLPRDDPGVHRGCRCAAAARRAARRSRSRW